MSKIVPSANWLRKEVLCEDPNDARVAITGLAYAGLSRTEIAALTVGDLSDTWVGLPGSRASKALELYQARAVLQSAIRSANLRDRCILECALILGMRQVEIRRLRIGDLSRVPAGGVLRVRGKGGGSREVPIPHSVAVRLEMMRTRSPSTRDAAPLLPTARGAAMSEAGIRKIIKSYLDPVAPGASPHSLRHTCVSWLLNEVGASLEDAMEIVGHTDAASHEVYTAVGDGWLVESWKEHHPIAMWLFDKKPFDPACSVLVRGERYDGRVVRGTERRVPLPPSLYRACRDALAGGRDASEPLVQGKDERQITRMYDSRPYSVGGLRQYGAVHMMESGAHPFLVAMMIGRTVQHVINSEYGRRTSLVAKQKIRVLARLERHANPGATDTER